LRGFFKTTRGGEKGGKRFKNEHKMTQRQTRNRCTRKKGWKITGEREKGLIKKPDNGGKGPGRKRGNVFFRTSRHKGPRGGVLIQETEKETGGTGGMGKYKKKKNDWSQMGEKKKKKTTRNVVRRDRTLGKKWDYDHFEKSGGV